MINSKDELKAYIKRQLGGGINRIEVTDLQIDDAIENAIGYYEREVDGGVEDRIFILQLIPGQQEYFLPHQVMGISEVFSTSMNSKDMMSEFNQFRIQSVQPMLDGSAKLSQYVVTMQYLAMINQFLAESVTFNFNPTTKKLYLHETIKNTDGILALTLLWSVRDTPEMWNNDFIKEYSTALVMKQWGINLSKFRGAALLGDMELNGETMLSLAQAEIDRLRADLIDRYTSPIGLWVG
jgi:hypothetical protein